MRGPLILALALGALTCANADRLITIPLGRKVVSQNFKFDTFADPNHARSWDRWIGFGVTPEFEVDYHGERFAGGPMRDTFDVSYNYVSPIVNQAPGISVGIQDVLNRTQDGRSFYLAATWRLSVDNVGSGNLPLETTLGIQQGKTMTPFVGVSIPFTQALRVEVEHNGRRLASGIEWRSPNDKFGARLVVRDQDVMVGANLTLHF